MNKLTVYKQMTLSPSDLFNVLRQEIGVKSNCKPFAIKAIDALRSLGNNLTEAEMTKAAHTFLDNLQTLIQGGITAEDYDKIDFVKRGNVITISARVEAFYGAAMRKGFIITDDIIPVPKEDADTTYFEEDFRNGGIVYLRKDKKIQADRKITAERLVENYFDKFICRLIIVDTNRGGPPLMKQIEMTNEEVLRAAAASDNGIFISQWVDKKDNKGNVLLKPDGSPRREKIENGLNYNSIWYKWTSQMVEKTVIRRALKRVREALPELKDAIYAFDSEPISQEPAPTPEPIDIEIPLEIVNVDLDNLTASQREDVKEMCDLFIANPKMAADIANEIMSKFNGNNAQEIINTHYAAIANFKRSKDLRLVIAPLFEKPDDRPRTVLQCALCGKEIKSEKSKKYYAEHPGYTVKCFDCNRKGKADA